MPAQRLLEQELVNKELAFYGHAPIDITDEMYTYVTADGDLKCTAALVATAQTLFTGRRASGAMDFVYPQTDDDVHAEGGSGADAAAALGDAGASSVAGGLAGPQLAPPSLLGGPRDGATSSSSSATTTSTTTAQRGL